MTSKIRVSFDYDSTLSEGNVQAFAKWCVMKGLEVWIVTSRLSDDSAPSTNWNNDLNFTRELIGIEEDHVHYTGYVRKHKFFSRKENQDFLFHVDDEQDEIEELEKYCPNIVAMNQTRDTTWVKKLVKLVEDKQNDTEQ